MADHGPAAEAHFWPKNLFFLRYTHITPIFRAQAGPSQEITSPLYPEVTLDTFGFPVGGRLAARRAVFRSQ